MKNLNDVFKLKDGYPLVKIYHQEHFYESFYEVELFGSALADEFGDFFSELVYLNLKMFDLNDYERFKHLKVYYRLNIHSFNKDFVQYLRKFFLLLKNIEKNGKKIKIAYFGNVQYELIQVFKECNLEFRTFESSVFLIEKIEWYWQGMHEEISPKIRFDSTKGEMFVLEEAVGEPTYDNHLTTILNWFKLVQNDKVIKVHFILFYYDMISEIMMKFVRLCKESFNTSTIEFIWHHTSDQTYGDYEEYTREQICSWFAPFDICFIEYDLSDDELERELRNKYQIYFEI